MNLLFLLVALASAEPPVALLAPGPDELREATEVVEARLREADAAAEAVSRLQNGWMDHGAKGCADPVAASLAARAHHMGHAWRDLAQTARNDLDRLQRVAAAPTVAPLVDPPQRKSLDALAERVRWHVRSYLEAQAFHERHVAPKSAACLAIVAPAAGLPRGEPLAEGELPAAVAVLGVGGGVLCPGRHPADGRMVVFDEGRACWDEVGCRCIPEPVAPGAALGPKGE